MHYQLCHRRSVRMTSAMPHLQFFASEGVHTPDATGATRRWCPPEMMGALALVDPWRPCRQLVSWLSGQSDGLLSRRTQVRALQGVVYSIDLSEVFVTRQLTPCMMSWVAHCHRSALTGQNVYIYTLVYGDMRIHIHMWRRSWC